MTHKQVRINELRLMISIAHTIGESKECVDSIRKYCKMRIKWLEDTK